MIVNDATKGKIKLVSYFLSLLLLTGLAVAPGMAGAVGSGLADTSSRTGSFVLLIPTVYVNGTTGNNIYNGSSPVFTSGNIGPKKTIAAGIDVVSDNGTVNVAAGIYHEHGLDLSETMNLVGAGALTTIIDADASGYVLQVKSNPNQRNTISGFTIRNGAPSGSDAGGGIYIAEAHIVTINDCAIVNNVKGGGSGPLPTVGGGVCNDGGTLYMNRCTVSGNTASAQGGGVYTNKTFGGDSGLAVLTNCTLSGNTVTDNGGGGGGIYCERNATMRLINVTIADNHATGAGSYGGGFANASPSSAYFMNCIVANNTAGNGFNNNGFDDFAGGAVFSLGHNIDSENSCFFTDATDQRNTNPLLGALQNNGGPTSTHAITASSPAFNRGTNDGAPATDQRGVTRPQGTSYDIGAFELIYTVNTATGTGTATFTTSAGSINSLTALAESALACTGNPGASFPHGFFSFTITGIPPGSTVTITITLPSNAPAGTQYWKCINGQWVNATSILGDNDGDTILTLTITDGSQFDADGQVNGTIVDPGGPALPVPGATVPAHRASPTLPTQLKPAQMSLQYLSVNPQQASANQPVTITTNVVNTGDEAGNHSIALKINGKVEQTKMVSVGPQGTQPVKFIVTRAQPGTYAVDIGGQKGRFTILGTGSSTTSTRSSGGLIAFLIMGAFIIATVAVLMLTFRRTT